MYNDLTSKKNSLTNYQIIMRIKSGHTAAIPNRSSSYYRTLGQKGEKSSMYDHCNHANIKTKISKILARKSDF